eukprot:14265378-Alexandrium_andersonii.AAC.1
MSASLVGSEMCIRDSARPDPWPLACPNGHRRASRCPARPSGMPPHSERACLLYTSDAADDM